MTKEMAIKILRGAVLGTDELTHEAVFMAIKALKEQERVDTVEVVRCEKCKWFGEEDEDDECWCFLNDISTLRHGFCYLGKRKKD